MGRHREHTSGKDGFVLTEDDSRSDWGALRLTLLLRCAYSLMGAAFGYVQAWNWSLVHSNALTETLSSPNHSLGYLLFGVWNRFDTLWYLHIAAHGYDRPDAIVFFPLYPLLIRIASLLVAPMAAALLISSVASGFFFWGLGELLAGDQSAGAARQSIFLCAVWPASFIFFAAYPESLLAALIVWALCMAARDCWSWAAVLGMAAALTKAVGIVVLLPLLVMAIRRRNRHALSVIFVPLGSVSFVAYLRWTGHGAIWSSYEHYWRTVSAPPWTTLGAAAHSLWDTGNPILALNLSCLIVVCVLVATSRVRIEYLLFSVGVMGAVLCKRTTPPLQSMIRYLLIVFPAYVGLARWLDRPFLRPRFGMVCAALFILNLALMWLFLGWSLVV